MLTNKNQCSTCEGTGEEINDFGPHPTTRSICRTCKGSGVIIPTEIRNHISMWEGKPLDSYSKEELMEIIHNLGEQLRLDRDQHAKDLDML